MLLIVTAQGLVALALAMQILHSTCPLLPVIPVTKAHWPMLPTVLLSQVLTGMQVHVQCMYSKTLLYTLCTFRGLVCMEEAEAQQCALLVHMESASTCWHA